MKGQQRVRPALSPLSQWAQAAWATAFRKSEKWADRYAASDELKLEIVMMCAVSKQVLELSHEFFACKL